jgi:hypothetical protein
MWSTVIPELMTITVWVLTFLCIRAGAEPGYLQGYAVVSINTTGLKYESSPLYDVYNIYMSTVCAGHYVNASPSSRLTNFTCTTPSSYCKLTPLLYDIPSQDAYPTVFTFLSPTELIVSI